MRKIGLLIGLVLYSLLFFVDAQYYYFDTGTSTYPYQQGCAEDLYVRINTQSLAPTAGLLRLLFDPINFSYSQSSLAADLQTQLFIASNTTFNNWTNPTGTPSWVDGDKTILQIDRNNGAIGYNGSNGLYGTIKFIPLYNQNIYTGSLGILYDGSTTKTTLSIGGVNKINPSYQNSRLTGNYLVLQQPCIGDTQAPQITITTPVNGLSKQNSVSGININLTDNGGSSSNVPFVWTGLNVRTGNLRGIDTQYGIDISTLQITIAGNGQSRTFNGSSYTTPNGKTWQFLDKNYMISIPSGQLFDYGIEKTISMNLSVRDRLGRQSSASISFNQPQAPTISNRYPSPSSTFVSLDSPISFDLTDDRAGVNTDTIQVTLSAVQSGGIAWGPYIFTGTQILSHQIFPSLSTVTVRVQARDNTNNLLDTSWSFVTRPNCLQLGCCEDKKIIVKNVLNSLSVNTLYISGGNNPYLSWTSGENTGYLNCGLENDGLSIYKGISGNSLFVSNINDNKLQISYSNPNNLKIILSGNTLYLSKIFDYGTLSEFKGGNGSREFKKDDCPKGDNSISYYDNTCEGDEEHPSATYCSVKNSPYSQEINEAFQYAYSVGMTTMCPIQTANLSSSITRNYLSKMLVEYAVNVVGLYPDVLKKGCDFEDLQDQSSEIKFFAKMACQLELMGMQNDGITPQKNFYPNSTITRAQFGTILSRLIFGYYYNIKTGENIPYYTHHLEALKRNDIIKLTDPNIKEQKSYIMLMLKRAYDSGLIDQGRFSTASKNGINAMLGK